MEPGELVVVHGFDENITGYINGRVFRLAKHHPTNGAWTVCFINPPTPDYFWFSEDHLIPLKDWPYPKINKQLVENTPETA